eukprot:5088753-Pyramimonas_sp.AAC.1
MLGPAGNIYGTTRESQRRPLRFLRRAPKSPKASYTAQLGSGALWRPREIPGNPREGHKQL